MVSLEGRSGSDEASASTPAPPSPSIIASLLSHPLLSNTPSTSALSSTLQNLQREVLPRSQAELVHSRRAFLTVLKQEREERARQKEELSNLPGEIESAEDEVMLLVTEMGLLDEKGQERVPALLGQLQRQRRDVEEAEKALPLLALLARGDELKQATLKGAKQEKGSAKAGLQALRDLCALVEEVRLASDSASQANEASTVCEYLTNQRDNALQELQKQLEARLRAALAESGWPPVSAEIAQARGEEVRSPSSTLDSKRVKEAWQRLCRLQRVAGRARLIDKASYSAENDKTAGSMEYTSLAPVKILMEPLLARFAYHFDGDKSTNRLDKPQWYINHMSNLLRSYSSLFEPQGKVSWLCEEGGVVGVGQRELVHFILAALRLKVSASKSELRKTPGVLAHTVGILLAFDNEVQALFPPTTIGRTQKMSDLLLGDPTTFDAWLEGERMEAVERLEEILEDKDAWLISSTDMDTDVDEDASNQTWEAVSSTTTTEQHRRGTQKTTRSARGLCQILEAISERARPLTLLVQRLGFLAIQDDLLTTYHQRLTRSLDAFESLSGAFARALPGGIASQDSSSESDMVRGLRGSSRLLKAFLSALHVSETLRRLSEESYSVQLSEDLNADTSEAKLARETRRSWTGKREEVELDGASLGELVRRGMRSGSGFRPLAASAVAASSKDGDRKSESNRATGGEDVWQEATSRFDKLAQRASKGLVRLVTSEVTEAMREYTLRSWNAPSSSRPSSGEEADSPDKEEEEQDDAPTSSLIPCLSLLETHFSHLVPALEATQCVPIYRSVARNISQYVVERVILAGGSHRFDLAGALRFQRDYLNGWMAVVNSLSTLARTSVGGSRMTGLGRLPEAPWHQLRDTAVLLSLSSASALPSQFLPTSVGGGQASQTLPSGQEQRNKWTLPRATRALFDEDPADDVKGWVALRSDLGLAEDYDLDTAKEVLRRRVECFK